MLYVPLFELLLGAEKSSGRLYRVPQTDPAAGRSLAHTDRRTVAVTVAVTGGGYCPCRVDDRAVVLGARGRRAGE